MMAKHLLAEGVNLALKSVLPAHPLGSEIKPADTGEEGTMNKHEQEKKRIKA